MKKQFVFFLFCLTILAACAQRPTPSPALVLINPSPTMKATAVKATSSVLAATLTPTPTRILVQVKSRSLAPEENDTNTPVPAAQEELKTAWRPVFQSTIILFSVCQMMYSTHIWLQEEEIDIETARAQLAVEADFIEIVHRGTFEWMPTEEAASYKASLERNLETLIELWSRMDSGEIGSPEITDPLFDSCSAFEYLQQQIVDAVLVSGLMIDDLDVLGTEVDEIIQDLYGSIMGTD